MKVLGIDTSCDDTCVAVVEERKILSNEISSQISLHSKFGGVVPDLARKAHKENIDFVLKKALEKARVKMEEVDLIAVTQGPGLSIALGVGIDKAKELAIKFEKKVVGVNHIEAHLLSPWLQNSRGKPERTIPLPALALTVSGGHSSLVVIEEIGKYKVIGESVDDAAGEALDKAAKMLGLGYPGGPILEQLAKTGKKDFLTLPIPMAKDKSYNFSFSGLKTSFYYQIKDWSEEEKGRQLANLASSFQAKVMETLLYKLERAVVEFRPKSLIGTGGVMANQYLRKQLRRRGKDLGLKVYLPYTKKLNTDNAAMIAFAGLQMYKRGITGEDWQKIEREPRMKLI